MLRDLSPHFTLEELTATQIGDRTGLDNTPRDWQMRNLTRVATALESVRALLGDVPVIISSGFRSEAVNRAVGGARDSAHLRGLAVDFIAPAYGTPRDIALRLIGHGNAIGWDQLIWEGRWVHLGLADAGKVPRREVLTAVFARGIPTQYRTGVV